MFNTSLHFFVSVRSLDHFFCFCSSVCHFKRDFVTKKMKPNGCFFFSALCSVIDVERTIKHQSILLFKVEGLAFFFDVN